MEVSPFLVAGAKQGNAIPTDPVPGSYPNTSSVVDVSSLSGEYGTFMCQVVIYFGQMDIPPGASLALLSMDAPLYTSLHTNFVERRKAEVRRITLPRTSLNNAHALCLVAPKPPTTVARKVYALDYPSGRTAGRERRGHGRGPKH
jgi:hypothetical protein